MIILVGALLGTLLGRRVGRFVKAVLHDWNGMTGRSGTFMTGRGTICACGNLTGGRLCGHPSSRMAYGGTTGEGDGTAEAECGAFGGMGVWRGGGCAASGEK